MWTDPEHTALPPTLPTQIRVAVVIDRQHQPSRWEDWRFTLADVTLDDGQYGDTPRLLRDDGKAAQFLFPGLPVELRRDEGEGYFLNLTSGAPVWFVMWRIDDGRPLARLARAGHAVVQRGRALLDAQERVDNRPLPAEVRDWLQAYTDAHYRPEPKKRRRPVSFVAPDQRD